MNRNVLVFVAALAATPLGAQQQTAPASAPAAPSEGKQIVAVVNGEVITQAKLDSLWERLGAQMRKQYEATGGKQGFLENYMRKRLLIQEAIKSGFDKRADVQLEVEAAKESTLFDLYVRDVISQAYVTDDAVREYYEQHKSEFSTPEKVKVRHIVVTPQNNSKEAAREKIEKAATELYPFRVSPNANPEVASQIFLSRFAQAAAKYSEDATATQGGDLGWVERGMLDKTFEEAAFNLKKGTMSGIIETKFGYHLIFVEDRKAPGTESLESARPDVREFLMAQNAAKVMEDVNRELSQLRMNSKITVYPENIK